MAGYPGGSYNPCRDGHSSRVYDCGMARPCGVDIQQCDGPMPCNNTHRTCNKVPVQRHDRTETCVYDAMTGRITCYVNNPCQKARQHPCIYEADTARRRQSVVADKSCACDGDMARYPDAPNAQRRDSGDRHRHDTGADRHTEGSNRAGIPGRPAPLIDATMAERPPIPPRKKAPQKDTKKTRSKSWWGNKSPKPGKKDAKASKHKARSSKSIGKNKGGLPKGGDTSRARSPIPSRHTTRSKIYDKPVIGYKQPYKKPPRKGLCSRLLSCFSRKKRGRVSSTRANVVSRSPSRARSATPQPIRSVTPSLLTPTSRYIAPKPSSRKQTVTPQSSMRSVTSKASSKK